MLGALLLLLAMLYLLSNDDLLLRQQDISRLKKIGKVAHAKNDVRQKVFRQFSWKSAKQLNDLHLGDSLFTGAGSTVEVQLSDGRILTLQENSLVVFASNENQLELDLKAGRLSGSVDGCVKLHGDLGKQDLCGKDSSVEVSAEGHLQVSNRNPAVAPSEPKVQLNWETEPNATYFHHKNNQAIKFSWIKNPIFPHYKLQFSRKADFKKIIFEEPTLDASLETKNYPKKGHYFVRVQGDSQIASSRKSMALKLAWTPAVKIEIQEIEAPVLTTPKSQQKFSFARNPDGDLLQANEVELNWDYLSNSKTAFELEISKSANFDKDSTRFEKIPGSRKQWIAKDLSSGQYFIRICDSQFAGEAEKVWSEPVAFQVEVQKPLKLASPSLINPRIQYDAPSEKPIVFRWTKVSEAVKYKIETSISEDFQESKNFESKSTEFKWDEVKNGKLYYRVSAISSKGAISDPSPGGMLLIRFKQPTLNPVEAQTVLGKSPEDLGEPKEFPVTWTDLKEVDSYQVQVSENLRFTRSTTVESILPSAVVTVPKPGEFYYRVRGMQKGLPASTFSKPGKLSYQLKVPLATPLPIEPVDQMTMFFQQTSLPYIWIEWAPIRQASNYQVEMAADPKFEQKVLSVETKDPRYLIREQLPSNLLYWRIRATGDDQRISNWSSTRTLNVLSGRAPASLRPLTPGTK